MAGCLSGFGSTRVDWNSTSWRALCAAEGRKPQGLTQGRAQDVVRDAEGILFERAERAVVRRLCRPEGAIAVGRVSKQQCLSAFLEQTGGVGRPGIEAERLTQDAHQLGPCCSSLPPDVQFRGSGKTHLAKDDSRGKRLADLDEVTRAQSGPGHDALPRTFRNAPSPHAACRIRASWSHLIEFHDSDKQFFAAIPAVVAGCTTDRATSWTPAFCTI